MNKKLGFAGQITTIEKNKLDRGTNQAQNGNKKLVPRTNQDYKKEETKS
jgi:hypothetical protein